MPPLFSRPTLHSAIIYCVIRFFCSPFVHSPQSRLSLSLSLAVSCKKHLLFTAHFDTHVSCVMCICASATSTSHHRMWMVQCIGCVRLALKPNCVCALNGRCVGHMGEIEAKSTWWMCVLLATVVAYTCSHTFASTARYVDIIRTQWHITVHPRCQMMVLHTHTHIHI